MVYLAGVAGAVSLIYSNCLKATFYGFLNSSLIKMLKVMKKIFLTEDIAFLSVTPNTIFF